MRLLLIFIVVGVSIASSALAQSTGQGRVDPSRALRVRRCQGRSSDHRRGRKF